MKLTVRIRIAIGSPTNALALSPDGALVAATSFDQKLRVFETAGMTLRKALHLGTSFPNAVCFAPDGGRVASGGKALTVFDTTTWKKGASLKGHRHEIQGADFSPDGARAYTASGNNYTPSDWTARAWDAATGAALWKYKLPRTATAVAASPDGRWVAAADCTGVVALLDAATGEAAWTSKVADWVYRLRFTPKGDAFVTAGDAHALHVVSVADGAVRAIPTPTASRSLALTPDGATALIAGTDYGAPVPIRAVDLATGSTRDVGPSLGRLPQGAALSPDGATYYVLVNEPDELIVFDVSR